MSQKNESFDMPVIARFFGIVMRLVIDRTFGMHVHAFYGDCELVVALNPLRVIQGDVPSWVQERVLGWLDLHERELLHARRVNLNLETPISRQAAGCLVFAD
ncbi:MAG TPA: DUF4160 domain-containing protein [Verrucomicrobiae bacterium]